MIQPIVHDPLFLAQKSARATPADADTARDLLETLTAHADGCVGMAANMIGVLKRIIAVEAEENGWRVPAPQTFRPDDTPVEGDWSAAGWWLTVDACKGAASRWKVSLRRAARVTGPL